MTSATHLVQALEEIIEDGVVQLPYTKGGDIYVNHSMVQKSRRGYVVFDTKLKKKLCETFSKTAAVAVAKLNTHSFDNRNIKDVLNIDNQICKWYMDCIFFRNSMETTEDDFRKDVLQTRYDIAYEKFYRLKQDLESYLYDK